MWGIHIPEQCNNMGDFPCGPVLKTLPSNARAQVRSLVRELRSLVVEKLKHKI